MERTSNGFVVVVTAVQRKKKKKLADIIAEKEAAKLAEYEAKTKNSTPEAIAKEKLRQLKIEEASNNKLLKDMMGKRRELNFSIYH